MPTASVVFEDVLDDALLGLAAAASIFVKNTTHQATAAESINALSWLVQTIDAQINGTATATAAPAATTQS